MKNLIYVFAVILLISCGGGTNKKASVAEQTKAAVQDNRIEVLYFHGAQRCVTCRAIEKHTKELLDSLYSKELKKGTIVFKAIDISQKENEAIADKYEVTWSSLFINGWKNNQETINNMTDYAFSYTKGQPEVFKAGINDKIEELRSKQ